MLLVYDVPTAIAFYRDALGFDVVYTSPPFDGAKDNYGWALLRKGDAELMLNNMYENNARPAVPDALRARHHGDTVLYFACPDVEAAYVHLRSKGIDAEPPKDTYYGMRQVFVRDPDGYALIFQRPTDGK